MRLFWTILFSLFVPFMVTIVCLKNAGLGGPFFSFFGQLPYHDKIGHFVLMGVLAFLAVGAIAPGLPIPLGKATQRIIIVLLVIIGLEELSQGLFPQRTLTFSDFLFSISGATSGGWLAYALHQWFRRRLHPPEH